MHGDVVLKKEHMFLVLFFVKKSASARERERDGKKKIDFTIRLYAVNYDNDQQPKDKRLSEENVTH